MHVPCRLLSQSRAFAHLWYDRCVGKDHGANFKDNVLVLRSGAGEVNSVGEFFLILVDYFKRWTLKYFLSWEDEAAVVLRSVINLQTHQYLTSHLYLTIHYLFCNVVLFLFSKWDNPIWNLWLIVVTLSLFISCTRISHYFSTSPSPKLIRHQWSKVLFSHFSGPHGSHLEKFLLVTEFLALWRFLFFFP